MKKEDFLLYTEGEGKGKYPVVTFNTKFKPKTSDSSTIIDGTATLLFYGFELDSENKLTLKDDASPNVFVRCVGETKRTNKNGKEKTVKQCTIVKNVDSAGTKKGAGSGSGPIALVGKYIVASKPSVEGESIEIEPDELVSLVKEAIKLKKEANKDKTAADGRSGFVAIDKDTDETAHDSEDNINDEENIVLIDEEKNNKKKGDEEMEEAKKIEKKALVLDEVNLRSLSVEELEAKRIEYLAQEIQGRSDALDKRIKELEERKKGLEAKNKNEAKNVYDSAKKSGKSLTETDRNKKNNLVNELERTNKALKNAKDQKEAFRVYGLDPEMALKDVVNPKVEIVNDVIKLVNEDAEYEKNKQILSDDETKKVPLTDEDRETVQILIKEYEDSLSEKEDKILDAIIAVNRAEKGSPVTDEMKERAESVKKADSQTQETTKKKEKKSHPVLKGVVAGVLTLALIGGIVATLVTCNSGKNPETTIDPSTSTEEENTDDPTIDDPTLDDPTLDDGTTVDADEVKANNLTALTESDDVAAAANEILNVAGKEVGTVIVDEASGTINFVSDDESRLYTISTDELESILASATTEEAVADTVAVIEDATEEYQNGNTSVVRTSYNAKDLYQDSNGDTSDALAEEYVQQYQEKTGVNDLYYSCDEGTTQVNVTLTGIGDDSLTIEESTWGKTDAYNKNSETGEKFAVIAAMTGSVNKYVSSSTQASTQASAYKFVGADGKTIWSSEKDRTL